MSQTRSKYYAKQHAGGSIAVFPDAIQITGTMTVVAGRKTVPCSGTAANFSNIKEGDFLCLLTAGNSEVIEITGTDTDKKLIMLKHETANAHTGVNIYVVQKKDAQDLSHVTIKFPAAATSLIINGNAVNPSTSGAYNSLSYRLSEPIVVECGSIFVITNAMQ